MIANFAAKYKHLLQKYFKERKGQQTAYAYEHKLGRPPFFPEIYHHVPGYVVGVPKSIRLSIVTRTRAKTWGRVR